MQELEEYLVNIDFCVYAKNKEEALEIVIKKFTEAHMPKDFYQESGSYISDYKARKVI